MAEGVAQGGALSWWVEDSTVLRGWSTVLSMRRSEEELRGTRGYSDGRVCGASAEGVRSALGHRISAGERSKRAEITVKEECRSGEIGFEELRMGSRRGEIPRVRS